MPSLYKFNGTRQRSRTYLKQSEFNQNSKIIKRRKCSLMIKIIKLISAILVPLMIAIFTVVTTMQESRTARLQRDADISKLERQAQLQQEAETRQRTVDAVKIKEQQERDDIYANEIRIQNVYDTFMKEISSIVLKTNINLTRSEMLFARAKTSLTLEQIDAKRKWHLIKFLYDSDLLYTSEFGLRFVDLTGVDLSNVKFGGAKRFNNQRLNLRGILLSKVQLTNSSFENVDLHQANFQFSDLNHSRFYSVSISGANFQNTILENSRFNLHSLRNTSFRNATLKSSSWSSFSPDNSIILTYTDFSGGDLTESIFQDMTIRTDVQFDRVNFERTVFLNIKFSVGTSFNNLNMKMVNFSSIELTSGKFIQCDMIGAIFEHCRFKDIIFDRVDLQQSQFNDISRLGSIEFNRVNLIDSNLNLSSNKAFRILDSFLPNGTFKTSSIPLGINLIKNGDAEQGHCYHSYQELDNSTPQSWTRNGTVIQMFYKTNDWQMNMSNSTTDLDSCFFFGGYQYLNRSDLDEYSIRQEINIERLSVLINARQAKYEASAYLGGFGNEQSSTLFKIGFKNTKNKTEYFNVGQVTNVHRKNQTTMIFCSSDGSIPSDTVLISFELIFQQQMSPSGLGFGMADNLNFVIQQKELG